jgi:menaquinol-cytochrome c reductase iron-sulfur subunit
VAVGALVSLVPLASGLLVFLDPLRRNKAQAKKFVRVASLETVPADGEPHRVPVIDIRVDAWNLYPPAPIGAVFLRRESAEAPLKAYSSVCPHLGCSVDFKTERNEYVCPCHNSLWNVDATRVDPLNCPAPRDLDELEVEVRNGDEVWVYYQKFRGGIERKIAE